VGLLCFGSINLLEKKLPRGIAIYLMYIQNKKPKSGETILIEAKKKDGK
jgi:hypothetical protein